MKNKLHIVGLRYYGWGGRMDEICASRDADDGAWIGQELFLQRNLHYTNDPHAVMAWTVTEPVGHVCKLDQPRIAGVLERGDRDLVVARIVRVDRVRRALVVQPEDGLPDIPLAEDCPTPCAWDGPVLPLPLMWAQADHFGRMMNLLARGAMPWNDEVVERYLQYTVTDLSGDAYRSRSSLAYTLLQSADPRLSAMGHHLLAVMDHMGGSERMKAWHELMVTRLVDSPEARSMVARHPETDVQRVVEALRSFPHEIGREWLAGNADAFVHRLYYAQIPRTEILKLLSLVALYASACRRTQSLPPLPASPAVGLSLGTVGQMQVGTLDNHGTVLSIEQARIGR